MAVDAALVGKWLHGWTAAREKPSPEAIAGGWRVDVNDPDQSARYVFPHADDNLQTLTRSIAPPLTPIKICAPRETVEPLLSSPWKIERVAPMMMLPGLRYETPAPAEGYSLAVTGVGTVFLAMAVSRDGDVVASGRIALVDDVAVFDQIQTQEAHRRLRLGSAVMRALQSAAAARGARIGMLVATEAGQALYTSLGWRVYAPYVTAIVPQSA